MKELAQNILERLYWNCIEYRGKYITLKDGVYEQIKFIPTISINGAYGHLRYKKDK